MKKVRKLTTALFLLFLLTTLMVPQVKAQDDDFSIVLTIPNEGETFYAGPSSMLYKIPVKGKVNSGSSNHSEVLVEIAVYQNAQQITSYTLSTNEKGEYETFAVVNPGAYVEAFVAEFLACGDSCHVNKADQFLNIQWDSSFDLPAGPSLLVVTATSPDGRTVKTERNIIVDRSSYATVPVQVVVVDGDQQKVMADIPVLGSTWLYMWRARFATGGTNSDGVANMKVEALSEAPTGYRFQVKPCVVNGVYYEGISPVDVVLPAGAKEGPPVTLQVRSKPGTIQGNVNGDMPLSQIQVFAIHLPQGDTTRAQVSVDGSFTFENISIGKYIITADQDLLAAHGYRMEAENIDLANLISASLEFDLDPLEGTAFAGNVMDAAGTRLPFAWVLASKNHAVAAVLPDTSQFSFFGLSEQKTTLVAHAPGYYSQALVADQADRDELSFKLVPRPETRRLAWGDGEIIVPPETRISASGQHVFVERGWLWGYNHDPEPLIIQSGQVEVSLSEGLFALEDVPGRTTWFYLFEGSGTIQASEESNAIPIKAGEMAALGERSKITSVPYNPVVVKTFHHKVTLPVATIFEPTFKAQISNRMAMIGIDLAKLITFITYLIIIVATVLLPVIALYSWLRPWISKKKTKI